MSLFDKIAEYSMFYEDTYQEYDLQNFNIPILDQGEVQRKGCGYRIIWPNVKKQYGTLQEKFSELINKNFYNEELMKELGLEKDREFLIKNNFYHERNAALISNGPLYVRVEFVRYKPYFSIGKYYTNFCGRGESLSEAYDKYIINLAINVDIAQNMLDEAKALQK